jgi:hypothetical protein
MARKPHLRSAAATSAASAVSAAVSAATSAAAFVAPGAAPTSPPAPTRNESEAVIVWALLRYKHTTTGYG